MSQLQTVLEPSQFRINHLIWMLILAVGAVDGIWLKTAGIQLDFAPIIVVFYLFFLFVAISLFYRYVRRDDTIFLLGHIACQMLTATGVLGILSYVTASINRPLVDEQLISIDHLFFFDWQHYVAWVNDRPLLANILSPAYESSGPQIILLVAILFLTKNSAHIQRLILAYITVAIITIVLAMIFPAVAGYVHYDIDLSTYPNLHPAAARIHEGPLLSMRSNTVHMLTFPLKGIVTFPSFHSALAVLMMYAAWPLGRVRWVFVVLNMIVLVSVPVDGGHWLTDVIGGVAIAPLGIKLAEKLMPSRPAVKQPPKLEA